MGYDKRLMRNVLAGVFYFKRALCSALVVGSLGLASGCGEEVSDTYEMGQVDLVAKVKNVAMNGEVTPDNDIFIGIMANGEKVVGYACNGKDGQEGPLSVWFDGDINDGSFDLMPIGEASAHGEIGLVGTFADDGSATGTFTDRAGYEHSFTTQAATDDDGTYISERTEKDGWIVIDGDMRGAVLNRGTDSVSTIGAGFNLSTGTATVGGDTITVSKATILNFH